MSTTDPATPLDLSELFSPRATLGRWLQVEAALSRAQALHGVIPSDAASRIEECADLEHVEIDEIARHQRETGHSMMGLVLALSAVVGEEHGGWVHWGGDDAEHRADRACARHPRGASGDPVPAG